jgi:uncharacterized protein
MGRHMGFPLFSRVAIFALLAASPAVAQSFDCSKARTPIEQAICASPALAAQDKALNDAYIAARANLASDSPEAAALRDSQRAWISERNRACGAGDAASCLAASYKARLSAIAAAAKAAPAASSPAAPAPTVAVAPAPAAPKPAVAPVQAGAAKLAQSRLPAGGEAQTLVTVERAGRFAIVAKSATGVALQLVDMIAGPGETLGEAGQRDGRLDLLLDKGVYKLKTFGAKDAKGEAELSVTPFAELEASNAQLGDGHSAALGDLQQRSYWVAVGKDGRLAVEAVGRALQDLRAWRNGRDMADLAPSAATVEPKAAKPMTRLRLEGQVEPGAYLVTAYGGAPAVWTDGDAASPFHIRSAEPINLAAGVAEGALGPFGFGRYRAPADADRFRLELSDIAPVAMTAERDASDVAAAAITKASREAFAQVDLAAKNNKPAIVEVSGREGQAFRLRALTKRGHLRFDGDGPYFVSVSVAGEGGDEVPATVVLARMDGKARALASDAIRLGPGQAWRRKFNLRGTTTLIFEMTAAGPVAIRTQGPAARATIEPLLGANAPRADGRAPGKYDLEAGWYMARLEPNAGARGAIDVTIGAPGLSVEPTPAPAARALIDFGQRTLERGASYQLLVNSAPGLTTAPRATAAPADLAKAPLALTQTIAAVAPPPARNLRPMSPVPRSAVPDSGPRREAPRRVERDGERRQSVPPKPATDAPTPPARPTTPETSAPSNALDIAVRAPLGGEIVVVDSRGQRVGAVLVDEKVEKTHRTLIVKIPPSNTTRALAVAWSPVAPPRSVAAPAPDVATQGLKAGEPIFFDLKRDEKRAFRLDVAEGGLMRVETLGRLKTAAQIGTSFLPKLDEADDNGAGHNALLQTYLRAGSYRVGVSASESAGRLGLVARPAKLSETQPLVVEGGVRAMLGDGEGAIVPITIAQAGDYRLDLYALGDDPMVRLEDADGWPLAKPDRMAKIVRRFEPGRYRLVVAPESVETRVVARLRAVAPPQAREGHGPFDLPFESKARHQWREPTASTAPRAPDVWRFALAGDAEVTLDLSEGMIGELIRGEKESLGKIVAKRVFFGKLGPGAYRVETRALGRDDRLDYEISLKSDALQPGAPRFVDAPQTLTFALAEDRVVALSSFGRIDMTAMLKDSEGRVVERLAGRADDWNLSFSKLLPAGAYSLVLSEVAAANVSGESSGEEDSSDQARSDGDDRQAADEEQDGKIEVRFALPQAVARETLDFAGSIKLDGAALNRLALKPAEAGRLVAVAAEASGEALLSLERQDADGRWRVMATDRGRSPLVAFVADQDAQRGWRVAAWSLDGAGPIVLAARAVQDAAQSQGRVALNKLPFDFGGGFCAGRVTAPQVGLVTLTHAGGLLHGSKPGQALRPVGDAAIAPQSDALWLATRSGCAEAAMAQSAPPAVDQIIALGAGERASLAAPGPEAGKLRAWIVESAFGQPSGDAGRGMGVAESSAFALSDGRALNLWNAGGEEALQMRARYVDVTATPARDVVGAYSALLPPRSAQTLRLGSGEQRVMVDLAAGAAAVAHGAQRNETVWSGLAPMSRALEGAFGDITLVNGGDAPAPVSVAVSPASAQGLDAGRVFKRFVGSAGSLSIPVAAQAGDILHVVGARAMFVGADGRVLRGEALRPNGAGSLVLTHPPGLMVAWLARDGKSAWPQAQAKSSALPARVALGGEAMSFAFKFDAPVLLTARSTAPLIAMARQGGGETPLVFPAGADLNRYFAAGEATLDIYSAHDGPLAGGLDMAASPIRMIGEGLGDAVALAPGATALFGFEVKRESEIGVGLRSDPDRASARLLDSSGKELAVGVNRMIRLTPGRYVLEARAPADGDTLLARPAIVGASPPPTAPPEDVTQQFLDLVGLKSGTK